MSKQSGTGETLDLPGALHLSHRFLGPSVAPGQLLLVLVQDAYILKDGNGFKLSTRPLFLASSHSQVLGVLTWSPS